MLFFILALRERNSVCLSPGRRQPAGGHGMGHGMDGAYGRAAQRMGSRAAYLESSTLLC